MIMNKNEVMIRLSNPEDLAPEKVISLCHFINQAYQIADQGIWQEWQRIDEETLTTLLKDQSVLIAEYEHKTVGCINVNLLTDVIAEFSMFAVDPSQQKLGIGHQLMQAAEQWAINHDRTIAQIEVVYPRDWLHPYKEYVKNWCQMNGYLAIYQGPFEELNAQLVAKLAHAKTATPCNYIIYHKKL